MRISLLITTAYGMGGTIRTTLTLASYLAREHEVEVVSVNRHRDKEFFPVDPKVRMRWLVDTREGARAGPLARALAGRSSLLFPRGDRGRGAYTLRSDAALWRYLRTLGSDVLITTRPGLNLLAARHAPRRVTRIGMEHLHFGAHRPALHQAMLRTYPRLDALVVLTEADRADYAKALPRGPAVHRIPNALVMADLPRSRMDNRVIAAAGRFVAVKSYDRLIRAFGQVVAAFPDWRLRLYGSGPEEEALRRLVHELDLHNHVLFMGRTADVEGEFAKASLVALTSRFEGFGMTVAEAFGCGVPVISFDCPRGPREIVQSGHNGVLVPSDGDDDGVPAYAAALRRLMEDGELRRKLAANALVSAADYDIERIGPRWDALLAGSRVPA
ncbi:glycosyltransferase family 4 protein [Bailinhaonella thermotolerans]|uniref:Glycosyltransferase family 4 protein n=1 Tax=Bailinhaonella thermotolerans TaxID=1070861 RepID=A0A3A4AS36_9ACTN|nr:glycosyltransferase family 4 protein [Bailinhaonella thermotolerans]RJL24128.1 glycosyltransferase family 4 protein [Bailinhaonella thermotolerans]